MRHGHVSWILRARELAVQQAFPSSRATSDVVIVTIDVVWGAMTPRYVGWHVGDRYPAATVPAANMSAGIGVSRRQVMAMGRSPWCETYLAVPRKR